MFNIKSLFLSCFNNEDGKFVLDIFYLNKDKELVDILGKKKLILNGKQFTKQDYTDNLVIEGVPYKKYIHEELTKGGWLNVDDIEMAHNTFQIKIEDNNYLLTDNGTTSEQIGDFCLAPLFMYETVSYLEKDVKIKTLGWAFLAFELSTELYEKKRNLLKNIKCTNNKISYEDIMKIKKFVDGIAQEYYDSNFNIEENEF